jgi:hypothetical protein
MSAVAKPETPRGSLSRIDAVILLRKLESLEELTDGNG